MGPIVDSLRHIKQRSPHDGAQKWETDTEKRRERGKRERCISHSMRWGKSFGKFQHSIFWGESKAGCCEVMEVPGVNEVCRIRSVTVTFASRRLFLGTVNGLCQVRWTQTCTWWHTGEHPRHECPHTHTHYHALFKMTWLYHFYKQYKATVPIHFNRHLKQQTVLDNEFSFPCMPTVTNPVFWLGGLCYLP